MRIKVAAGAVVIAFCLVLAGSAWADPVPLCNGQQCLPVGSWYTSPVSVTWSFGTNGGGCAPQNYSTDTNQLYLLSEPMADWPEWTYCNDTSSDELKYYFIQVEVSSPTATATPSRAPDSNGWYNHPVAGAVSATSFSGIASCTSTTYAGPNTTSATVTGTCTDNAGKTVTVTSAPFAYDATAPTLTATATASSAGVALNWQTTGDIAPLASVDVVRTTGGDPQTVYSGTGSGYTDTRVTDGTQYTYTITARDAAGNAAVRTVVATPPAPVVTTAATTAHITSPPLLRWKAVRSATYYNVQLYRDGKTKVLSIWPGRAHLQLRHTWRYDGRSYRLKPGRYKWYVWPGFGKRKWARYGRMIGTGTFVIAS